MWKTEQTCVQKCRAVQHCNCQRGDTSRGPGRDCFHLSEVPPVESLRQHQGGEKSANCEDDGAGKTCSSPNTMKEYENNNID